MYIRDTLCYIREGGLELLVNPNIILCIYRRGTRLDRETNFSPYSNFFIKHTIRR